MLTLVVADAELELIPQALTGHPAVRASAKKRGRSPVTILLDSSLHHPALRKFPEGDRRGRPDIVHTVLLLCLDSLLNVEGGLRTIVHTRNDEVIRIAPQTRIPKNYVRFCGLMEDLFQRGQVPPEEPLLTLERNVTLGALLETLEGETWAFSEKGEPIDLAVELPRVKTGLIAVVGGFPHGDFRSPVADLCDRVVAIHSEPLKAWTVASELLVTYRLVRGKRLARTGRCRKGAGAGLE